MSATEVIVIVFPLGRSPEDWTAEFTRAKLFLGFFP